MHTRSIWSRGGERRAPLLGGAAATLLACGAVAAGNALAKSTTKPTLKIGMSFALATLDPSKNGNGPGNTLLDLAYAPLINLNANGKTSPGLATAWRYVGAGNKVFQLTLRPGARFADGSVVTAAAVKASLEYFAHNSPTLGTAMGAIQSITTPGKWTVRINLKAPNPMMPLTLSDGFNWGFVIGPKALHDPTSIGTTTDGAGPYTLVKSGTVSGDHYTLEPNHYYYDPAAIKWGKVVVSVITSPSSLLQAAATGQVNVAMGDATTADTAANDGLQVQHATAGTFGFWLLDKSGTVSAPLANVQVRQALNYAINRAALVKAFAGNYGVPTSEQETIDGWDPKLRSHYSYSPSTAKALLAAAGYPHGFTFTAVSANDPTSTGVMQAVAQNLAAVGVTMNVDAVASSDQATAALSGTYPAVLWTRGGDPTWLFYGLFLGPKALLNEHGWDDPVIDRLWQKGQEAKNPGVDWQDIIDRTVNQADFIPLYTYQNIYYVSKSVGGVDITASDPIAPFATTWYPK
jgi:peptide/nickel transport system substrate-binding protein